MKAYGRGKIVCCAGHTKYGKHKTNRWFNETTEHKRNSVRGAKKRARQLNKKICLVEILKKD